MSEPITKALSLEGRILLIDEAQGKRFKYCIGIARKIAEEGIMRLLKRCALSRVDPETSAIKAIIDSAIKGKKSWQTA